MTTEYALFDRDDSDWAEQQRKLETEALDMTYRQLHHRIATGRTTIADLVSLDLIARAAQLKPVNAIVSQPLDYSEN